MTALLRLELWRTWIMFRRYPIPHVGYTIITFIIFYGLFLGSNYLTGQAEMRASRLDALVIGYVAWTLSMTAVADISLHLQEDMASGTLEHICLSPYGPTRVYLARGLAKLLINVVSVTVVGLLIMMATGHWVHPSPLAAPAMVLMLGSAYGFSLFFGGVTMLFKRLGGLFGLVQMLLLYLTLVPIEEQPLRTQLISVLFPITPSVSLLRQVLASSPRVDSLQVALALANTALYLSAGILVFRRADRVMRSKGSTHQF